MKKMQNNSPKSSVTPISLHVDKGESRWMTIDKDNKKISESVTPEGAIHDAQRITDDFTVVFIPQKGETYIF